VSNLCFSCFYLFRNISQFSPIESRSELETLLLFIVKHFVIFILKRATQKTDPDV